LREIGVPVSVEDIPFREEVGYRIRPDEYALPNLDLTAEETAALHVAVEAMTSEGNEARAALWKLGGNPEKSDLALGAIPSLPALPALFDAYRNRASVSFTYRSETRELDLYGLVFRRGRWYAVGFDHAREAERAFRVDRIDGAINIGAAGTVERPEHLDVAALVSADPTQFTQDDPVEVVLRIDANYVIEARQVYRDANEEETPDGVVMRFTITNREAFIDSVVGFLDRAEIVAPTELRDALIARIYESLMHA
jgi:proteasome accessory factor B